MKEPLGAFAFEARRVLARINHNARVYVVTVPASAAYADLQRWPPVVLERSRGKGLA